LMEQKRHSLTERQGELAAVRREADRISRSVSNISELITALDQTVAEKTGLATYNKQLPKGADAGQPGSHGKAPDGKAAATAKETEVAVVLSPGSGPLLGPPGRMQPAMPFHLAKGKLPMPAHGRTVVSYGETTSNGRKSQGIVIQTRYGAQVTTPSDGWVVYAG